MALGRAATTSKRTVQVAVAAAITVAFLAVGSITGAAVTDSDTDRRSTVDDRDDFPGRGHAYGRDKDSDEFPGRGHGHALGHNKDSDEFPGRGHAYGRDKDSDEFPGRGQGRALGHDKSWKDGDGFPGRGAKPPKPPKPPRP